MSQYLGDISAYALAVSQGYTGTEEEYAELMASYATVGQTAVTAAQTATTKASEAATAATTATNKASEATTAATTATNKAAEAQADADAAALDASQAMSAASTATTKATEATTAAATATSAKNDAVAANTAAQSAKTAAQTAQTGAETAAASVEASAEQIATNAEDISQLKSEFTALESDGVVPSAEQILTDKGVTDSVPYHYRKTGGNGSDRLYDQIVGGSLAVNQLVPDLGTLTSSGSKAFNNGSTKIAGHKYLFSANISADGNTVGLYSKADDVGTTEIILNYSVQSAIISAKKTSTSDGTNNNSNGNMWLYPHIPNGSISNIMFIDLTAMFGSTIADYIYSLEQTTAGAGVAFFKALFPNDYYEYNAGELLSVSGLSEHKMTGFNQWDEEWEQGAISYENGRDYENTVNYRSKNFTPLLPNCDYYFRYNGTDIIGLRYYDENKNYIGFFSLSAQGASLLMRGTSRLPRNARYIRFTNTTKNVYQNDICINLSDPAKNGTYEPYKAHSYPLDSTLTLRGLFKLDANNNLYADGDTYDADGTVTRKYGIVDLGTLIWTKSTDYANPIFYASISDIISGVQDKKLVCIKYDYVVGLSAGTVADYTTPVIGTPTTNTQVIVRDPNYDSSDATTFKTAMSGVYLVYRLATPTTEEADPYQHLQQCDPDGTEEYVSTGIVPVGHNSFYPENLRAKVEQLPWNFATLIAPTESAFVATRNYTTGSLFIVDNVLYKATANIANDGTITPNTNCTATTLAEIISALA